MLGTIRGTIRGLFATALGLITAAFVLGGIWCVTMSVFVLASVVSRVTSWLPPIPYEFLGLLLGLFVRSTAFAVAVGAAMWFLSAYFDSTPEPGLDDHELGQPSLVENTKDDEASRIRNIVDNRADEDTVRLLDDDHRVDTKDGAYASGPSPRVSVRRRHTQGEDMSLEDTQQTLKHDVKMRPRPQGLGTVT